jgi:hypothetical protein
MKFVRYINRIIWIKYVVYGIMTLLVFGSILFPASAQLSLDVGTSNTQTGAENSERVFTVYGVEVDVSARTASAARSLAIQQAETTAFWQLMRKLTPGDDYNRIPDPGTDGIRDLVRSLEIVRERAFGRRYTASFNISFHPEKTQQMFGLAGVAYSEVAGGPYLILPVFDHGGVYLLWEEENIWAKAVRSRDLLNRLILYRLAEGNFSDRLQVNGAAAVGDAQSSRLEAIAEANGASNVLLMLASLADDPNNNRRRLDYAFRVGYGGPMTRGSLMELNGEGDIALMERGAEVILNRLDLSWRERTLTRFGEFSELRATIAVQSAEDWVTVRNRLNATPIIREIVVNRVGIPFSEVSVIYLGVPTQLRLTLLQVGLDLSQRADGSGWKIVLAELSTGTPNSDRQ